MNAISIIAVAASGFAELAVASNFSFLRGASHAAELVARAAELGIAAIAIADRNTLAGAVRAHMAAKEAKLRLLIGSRLVTTDGIELLVWPTDRAAYGRLCSLLTQGNLRAIKGACHLTLDDISAHAEGMWAALVPPDDLGDDCAATLTQLRAAFGTRLSLAAAPRYRGNDRERLWRLDQLARQTDVPLLATNDVLMHVPERRPLADVLVCIREHCTIDEAGLRLAANAERHLKSPDEMAALFASYPEAIARGLEIMEACRFSLDELRYEYPAEPVPEGMTPQQEMERQTWLGAARRYPDGVPENVKKQIEHEFKLIGERQYAPYFLTVFDIVREARRLDILCQGRGSAANSTVCYCLHITEIDPVRNNLLFERFISTARDEPPDIDVDFEHERREEVIQYIYGKYGRHRAGIAATVISWRSRSAIREVGKALGLSADSITALTGNLWGSWGGGLEDRGVRDVGLDPATSRLRLALDLAREIYGFPRHLSQHVGGFVLTRGPLSEVVPIGNAAMEDRTFVEWDRDDLNALGILKIDVLALGMLTALRKGFTMMADHHGVTRADGAPYKPADVPAEDEATYAMLQKADAIGVFQVESRAQMSMLPRLKPREFYDLVIEVAIVRPGPIQGDMVHPYLRRRDGKEKVEIPSPALEHVLGKTKGVPLFQEQAMKIAIIGAGFTPAEADGLRRAMATFRHNGTIHLYREKFIAGMRANNYTQDFAERCFKQIEGFGEYGFPESHAASFALLAYVSAWMKCYYPAAFTCALLNSQPMGFYAAAQLVSDVRAHNVAVLPVDVNRSDWDCTLEGSREKPALRLGFRQIKGFGEDDAEKLMTARGAGYTHPRELWRKTGLDKGALEVLAEADAFAGIGFSRRDALWAVKGLGEAALPLFRALDGDNEQAVRLANATVGEEVVNDYHSLRLSLRRHPLAILRPDLTRGGVVPAENLARVDNGAAVRVAGLAITRQRPGEGNVVFVTLEDETGIANIIVRMKTYEMYRRAVIASGLLYVEGRVQKVGDPTKETVVIHVVADRCFDWSHHLDKLLPEPVTRDFAPRGQPQGMPEPHRGPHRPPLRAISHDFR